MNRRNFIKLSVICFIISVIVLAIDYFLFHYLTDAGFTLIKQEEAGKPFVTDLVGQLGVLFFFGGCISMLIAFIFCDKEKKD